MADLTGMMQAAAGNAGNPNAWDISKAYYDAGADAWDISKAFYSNVIKSVGAQDTFPTDLFFKPDGTKMYILGNTGDDVNEYTLSTPWLVSSATYVTNFSVAAQDGNPFGLSFKTDGTKMYIAGAGNPRIYEYDLSTAWDISSASYVQFFSTATEEASPRTVKFKPDGTKMYVLGTTNFVHEYNLSSAWDVSSASYLQEFSVNTQEATPRGLFFQTDGTRMYISGPTGDDVNEYSLSTAWDVTSASYVQNFSVSAQDNGPNGLFFPPDGSSFYFVGTGSDTVYQYAIGGFSVNAQQADPRSLFFKPDGTKMYVTGRGNDNVDEYDLSTAWDITTASFLQAFSVSSREQNATGVFFKNDGTKMYVSGQSGQDVNEYDLSSAWDVSSASYVQVFSFSSQTTSPADLFFSPDGTRMYVVGATTDDVIQYSLSSAWDVSSASYVQNFSVNAQEATPGGVFFKFDGTTMYVIGTSGDDINQYSLSSAWDISTASYVQNFSVGGQERDPLGLFFSPDGTQFFITGPDRDKVFSYTISPI